MAAWGEPRHRLAGWPAVGWLVLAVGCAMPGPVAPARPAAEAGSAGPRPGPPRQRARGAGAVGRRHPAQPLLQPDAGVGGGPHRRLPDAVRGLRPGPGGGLLGADAPARPAAGPPAGVPLRPPQ